jgi:osmoprotectant transport system substrate-binding protein
MLSTLKPLTAFVAVILAAWTTSASAQVVVSSKMDTEGGLLGNVISQVLQAHGIPVEEKIQLGNTVILRNAITAGEIDIYPEYTGNAAFFFDRPSDPLWNDAALAYAEAAKLDDEANKIIWLQPAPANNTWTVAIRQDLAGANGIVTFSDFGRWVMAGGQVKLIASPDFVNSPGALPAFEKTYGFTLTPEQLVTITPGDTAATIQAAAQQTSGVNTAMVYGTDGGINASGLVVLEDDKGVQPVYEPAPIIREVVLQQYPEIEGLLAPVFQKLDLATLQELNGRIQVGGETAQSVAVDWLQSNGLLQ